MDLDRRASRLWLLAPAGAGLLVAALGSLLLGRKPLSTDEAFALALARQPFADLLDDAVAARLGELGHLLVVHPIVRVNDAEWAVRAPSVVAAAVAAVLLYVVGERLFGRIAGAVAAFTLALHAGVVGAAQLAQPYTLALLGIVASTLLFLIACERGSSVSVLAYVLSASLLPLLHPAAASVLAAHLAAAFVFERRSWATVAAALAGVAVATPLLVVIALDRADLDAGAGLGGSAELAEGIGRAAGWNPVLVVLAGLGVAAAAVRLRAAALWKAVLVGGLALAPVLALLVAALAVPVFPTRAIVLAAPGLALGAGAAVAALVERQAVVAAAALGAVAAVALVLTYAAGPDEDWRRAARAVRLVAKPKETVVVVPERAEPAFSYYAPEIQTAARARGEAAWVVVRADTPLEAIELGRTVVQTPRYALRRQFRYGDGLRLQHWIRP